MKFVACYIVYNEAEFIEASVRSIEPYMDKIIIIEGCHKDNEVYTKEARSTDGTCEIAKKLAVEFADKIIYEEYNGDCQQSQRNRYIDYLNDGDIMFQIDGDEAFTHNSMINIRNYFILNPTLDFMAIRALLILPNGEHHYIFGNNIFAAASWDVIRWEKGWRFRDVKDQDGNYENFGVHPYPRTENGSGVPIFILDDKSRIYIPHDTAVNMHYRFCKNPERLARKDSLYSLVRKGTYWPDVTPEMEEQEIMEILRTRYSSEWWTGDNCVSELNQKHPWSISKYTNVKFKNRKELFEQ